MVNTPLPFWYDIVTRGGGGTLPQLTLQDITGSGTPTASHSRVTVLPSDTFTKRWGGVMTTGRAENGIPAVNTKEVSFFFKFS